MAVTAGSAPLRRIARLGWRPDLPDHRDHLYAAPPNALRALPPVVNLEPLCPPIYDQGDLGSCTSNAISAAVQFDWMRLHTHGTVVPSRLFNYYNERAIEGSTSYDAGAELRDGIKVVAKFGAPPETEWPYDIAKFTVQPPPSVYTDALLNQAVQYARVTQSAMQMKGCLASGLPFVFGFTVFESFESQDVATHGIVPMPRHNEAVLGGHAVMAIGYNETTRRFRVRNSWGTGWGQAGYFEMPYAYLTSRSLASDFWVIRLMES